MASLIEIPAFAVKRVPEVHFGPGRARAIAEDAAVLGHPRKPVVLVADRALVELGVAGRLTAALEAAGAEVALFADIDGRAQAASRSRRRPTSSASTPRAWSSASAAARPWTSARSPRPLPHRRRPGRLRDGRQGRCPSCSVPKICLPTTAGTGSEFSSTNIFTNPAGKKVWVWGPETKPERVILDPELTTTLPPDLTAWTGLDAFVHALEASTNACQHPWSNLYAHRALGLIAGALETAVREPGNLTARGHMLLGAAHAGIAIDNCGCALAHNISHALAALGPMHHGLATALALEVVLPWAGGGRPGRVRGGGRSLRSRARRGGAAGLVFRLPHPRRASSGGCRRPFGT